MQNNISKDIAITKIQGQVFILESIKPSKFFSNNFKEWRKESENILDNIFGNGSRQLKDFETIKYQPNIRFLSNSTNDKTQVEYFKKGLDEAKRMLESFVKEIREYQGEYIVETNNNSTVGLNDVIEIKPNFMGLGININALIKKYLKKR